MRSAEDILKDLMPDPRRPGPVARVSKFLGGFRFLFMPLALFCLIAVGVHAAADTLDDRLLWVVDHMDAWADTVFSAWSVTEDWVRWIDLEDRTRIARALTLLWELAAVAVLAIPAFGYREQENGRELRGFAALVGTPERRWKDMFKDVFRRPTVLRVTRPVATLAVVLAGGCAVARMVQGALYLSTREWLGDGFSGPLARLAAIAALAGVLIAFGMRAVLRNLQHADEIATEEPGAPWLRIFAQGTLGSAIVIPLAVAALLDAAPVLSFFR